MRLTVVLCVMRKRISRPLIPFAACLLLAAPVRAQSAVDPSGHWEGSIQVQGRDIPVVVDLAKQNGGGFSGTIGLPQENLAGLPMQSVTFEGGWVTFSVRSDQVFKAALSADGKSMSGDYTVSAGSVPFGMDRKGDAVIAAPPKSPKITRELEGTWNASPTVGGATMRLVLALANQADGMATGTISNLEEGGVTIPLTIKQAGANVTLEIAPVKASYAGTLNSAGTELAGTYTQAGVTIPVTFQRAAPAR